MAEPYSAGVRPHRIEWVQETEKGVTPSDPAWNLFSDNVISLWDWEPDANTETQRGVGSIEPQGFFNGSETHEASFTYDLQQWYVDGGGNTIDAGGDFLRPSADNAVRATHTVVTREEHSTGGAADSGRRLYTVGKGGTPDSITVPFETEDGSPIEQELNYQFEKIRQYDVSQPSGDLDTTGTVESTSANDTTQTLTLENEGAGESVSVSLNGTTQVTISGTLTGIDAAELDAETEGDVLVKDGSGNTLLTIKGQNSYPAGEGDLGIPALGSGSHASALGTSYVRFLDDTLSVPNAPTDLEIISGELSVETGLDDNSQVGSARRNIHATEFSYTFSVTLASPNVGHTQTLNYLTETTGTISWTADEGSIGGNNAFITSPGSYTKESGNGKLTMDNEFSAESLTISN